MSRISLLQKWAVVASIAIASFGCRYAVAAEIYVPLDYPQIMFAIRAAKDGDVVVVAPGRYERISDFMGKAIIVRSTRPDDLSIVWSTIIDGANHGRCVTFKNGESSSSVLCGFTITGGSEREHSGYYPEQEGGAIACLSSSPTIAKNLFFGNKAKYGAGIYCYQASPFIAENHFNGNDLYFDGSSAVVSANVLAACAIETKHSPTPPTDSNMTIAGNTIVGSDSTAIDADAYLAPAIAVVNNELIGNAQAIYASGYVVIHDNLIAGNQHVYYSTVDLSDWEGTFTGNLVANNTGDLGGGVWVDTWGDTTSYVVNNTIVGNNAQKGGGIACNAKTLVISGNTIAGNYAEASGGGIFSEYMYGVISSNVIAGNSVGVGASLHPAAEPGIGGGVYLLFPRTILFAHNTVVGNQAVVSHQEGGGGGLAIDQGSRTVRMHGCIFRDNQPELGGQIALGRTMTPDPITAEITHCEIESGQQGIVIDPQAQIMWGPGNIDADPLFVDPGHWDDAGTPSDHSDDTFTLGDYHLLPGSPCIDAGTNDVDNPDTPEIETLPATDIAGLPRVIDGNLDGTATVDIGAYEYLPGDVNYDGTVNVLDLILVRNSLGSDPASSAEARKADVNADGAVNVQDLLLVRGRLGR
ncbi:MAG TPA: right-handed parallel beta-helix repeat-containing protein [Planctomycetota bacterium]|nr:right-handed parallel beta-helix repeat-containing protein [Planctomycetota bacterium]